MLGLGQRRGPTCRRPSPTFGGDYGVSRLDTLKMIQWINNLGYKLAPGTCILCHAPSHRNLDICTSCEGDLPYLEHGCLRCAEPMVTANETCGRCRTRPPPFYKSISLFHYRFPVDRLIIDFKFKQQLIYGKILSSLLAERLARPRLSRLCKPIDLPDILIPVPLHKDRLRSRGFNQAQEIAQVISNRVGISIDARACVRFRHTDPQVDLTETERQRNISGSFRVLGNLAARNIAIVDDVTTTGATVSELSRTLLNHGARSIQVWTLARTPSGGGQFT